VYLLAVVGQADGGGPIDPRPIAFSYYKVWHKFRCREEFRVFKQFKAKNRLRLRYVLVTLTA
jgi:hypothetical protein